MKNILFSIDGRLNLAEEIIKTINTHTPNSIALGSLNSEKFLDGELSVDFLESVRGKRVYLLSSPNNSDKIIKLELAIDAAKRADAAEIIPILPFFPYQRSDKKDQSRGPIGAKVMALKIQLLGATSVLTYDLHADQIQGFFEIPVTHIEGKNVFGRYIKELYDQSLSPSSLILCGPDFGSGKRVKRVKAQLSKYHGIDLDMVIMDKTRSKANKVDSMIVIGDVRGKDVIILDDMIDTGGTLCTGVDVLLENGANSVRAIISHGVLSGKAYENIAKSNLVELVISDSLPTKEGAEKIKTISATNQIAMAMVAINEDLSYELLRNTI